MKTMKMTLAIVGIPVLAMVTSLASGVTSAEATRWVCSLTGKTIEKCCCVTQKDGKLYCTLAKKTVDNCCCKPAEKK